MTENSPLVPFDEIGKRILLIRGRRVMLDSDLASLYGVTTGRLNQQVSRNIGRFPDDFMFRLSQEEYSALMLQNATSKKGRGGRRKLPSVFTQEGVSMLSGVLQSERAIDVNIAIMRAFVRLRQMISMNAELAAKLAELERKIEKHDRSIRTLFQAIRQLMAPPAPPRPRIGFRPDP
ncbi:MAG: ORF6N domain-containing protein [Elusimicrobia bacterium]|nr:ORF6N domain-containing protein [Elusimicrobiota bacterium]